MIVRLMMAKILVSIHDVHQGNYTKIQSFLDSFKDSSLKNKVALMVVPAYKSIIPLKNNADFCIWLNEKQAQGHEIFVHGLNHCTTKVLVRSGIQISKIRHRSVFGTWINNFLVNNEAEFCGWSEKDKIEVAGLAKQQFFECGINSQGFVAPTWHGGLTLKSLQDLGFQFSESRFFVFNVDKGISKLMIPFTFFSRKGIFYSILDVIQPYLFQFLSIIYPSFRLVIHPVDLQNHSKIQQITKIIKSGKLVQYRGIME